MDGPRGPYGRNERTIMKTNLLFGSVTGLAALLSLTIAPPVRAQSLDACGDIHVEASAECTIETGIECTAQCEEFKFEASCAASNLNCSH